MTTLTPHRDAMIAGVEEVRRALEAKHVSTLQEQTTAQFTLGCLAGVMVTAGEARDRGMACGAMLDAASAALANAVISLAGFVGGNGHTLEEGATDILIRLTANIRLRLESGKMEGVSITIPADAAGRA